MKTFAFLAMLSIFHCPTLYGQPGGNAGEQPAAKAAPKPTEVIFTYQLMNITSAAALEILQQMYPQIQFAQDERLNSILARASDEEQRAIAKLIEQIDSKDGNQNKAVSTKIIHGKGREFELSQRIVQSFAENSGVNLAFDTKLGVVILKGPGQEVERMCELIEQIGKVSKAAEVEKPALRPYALRVFWLSNEPAEDNSQTADDPAFESSNQKKVFENTIQKKLAALGFANMTIKMQLLGRCDLINGRAQCKVDGTQDGKNADRTLNFQAALQGESSESITGKISIVAGVTIAGATGTITNEPADLSAKVRTSSPSNTTSNRIEVEVNLQPQKTYILSASPIGGFQSAFVVQLLDDF